MLGHKHTFTFVTYVTSVCPSIQNVLPLTCRQATDHPHSDGGGVDVQLLLKEMWRLDRECSIEIWVKYAEGGSDITYFTPPH